MPESEYESADFEHIWDKIIDKKNPRKEMDERYPDLSQKLRVIQTAIRKFNLELDDLEQADSTNYGHDELDRMVDLRESIVTFTAMEKELEAQGYEESNVQDLTDRNVG